MTSWLDALRAMRPRALLAQRRRVEGLAETVKGLRKEIKDTRRGVDELQHRLDAASRQIAQTTALITADVADGAELDALRELLEPHRLAAHARAAIEQAAIEDRPRPHAIIVDILPPDVLRTAIANVPRDVFLETRHGGGAQARVPPLIAPTASLVAWDALGELVKREIGPQLIRRFEARLKAYGRTVCFSGESTAGVGVPWRVDPGRLLLDRRSSDRRAGGRPWHLLTASVLLVDPSSPSTYRVRIAVGGVDGAVEARELRCRPGSTVVALGGHISISYEEEEVGAGEAASAPVWEFGVVVPRQSREGLLSGMPAEARAAFTDVESEGRQYASGVGPPSDDAT